jgi:hypothetical protein
MGRSLGENPDLLDTFLFLGAGSRLSTIHLVRYLESGTERFIEVRHDQTVGEAIASGDQWIEDDDD